MVNPLVYLVELHVGQADRIVVNLEHARWLVTWLNIFRIIEVREMDVPRRYVTVPHLLHVLIVGPVV